MNRLDATFATRPRPKARILQFGGGNFLRGFFDWKIDRLNEATGDDFGIVILRSIGSTEGSALNAQDGLFTVLTRGLDEKGDPVSEPRLVHSVLGELSCQTEWWRVRELARDPEIRIVVSNTTETGITYDATARLDDCPAASYPAKVAQLLHDRWLAMRDRTANGWQFIACELTDHAGDELRRIVLQHCFEWKLEPEFIAWVEWENSFHNTLVDRIVSGFPKGGNADIAAELGYEDLCLTVAEPYHFLAIEVRPDQIPLRIALAQHDAGTITVPDVAPYKLRKVAILNGAHTMLCPLALLAGLSTVREAMDLQSVRALLATFLETEVKPFVDLPKVELDAFADAVFNRFANPYLNHAWHDISLNGLAKLRARLLDRLDAYIAHHGEPAPLIALSLAGWLRFYTHGAAASIVPRDSAPVLAWASSLATLDDGTKSGREALTSAFLSESSIWGRSLDTPDLHKAVAKHYALISAKDFAMDKIAIPAIAAA